VEQTGQINVPSEGLWDIGSPMGSPNNEKVTPISKNRAPRFLFFCLRDGCCSKVRQIHHCRVRSRCRKGHHGQTQSGHDWTEAASDGSENAMSLSSVGSCGVQVRGRYARRAWRCCGGWLRFPPSYGAAQRISVAGPSLRIVSFATPTRRLPDMSSRGNLKRPGSASIMNS
jgi:hypothetical protein